METTLHRQLKSLYATKADRQEVAVDGYRIDAIQRGRLIEIQQASLGAIQTKVRRLLEHHSVVVVKPLAARKFLIKRNPKNPEPVSQRYSPLRQTYLDFFVDLVHFVKAFPHPRLTVDVLLTEQEEHRVTRPPRGRRRPYSVEDRMLRDVVDRRRLRTANDLIRLLPDDLDEPFTTLELAERSDSPRWMAQKIAYCLRETGAADVVGKRGNALTYRLRRRRRKAG